ncbi:hypothetical protein D3C72_1403490 [compost metagenome]
MRVRAQFALVDQAFLGVVDEFDRVFHREDVTHVLVVAVIDHGRQRGRLARAGRAGHEHEAAWLHAEVREHGRCMEVIERQDFRRNGPEHRGGAALRGVGIDPEP